MTREEMIQSAIQESLPEGFIVKRLASSDPDTLRLKVSAYGKDFIFAIGSYKVDRSFFRYGELSDWLVRKLKDLRDLE